jgi:cardiolipin synthase A/B
MILPSLPDKDALVQAFDLARERLWVEIYTWTERDTLAALIRAHERGVDTRVILEGNVYGTPRINDDTYDTLKNAGIPVIFADNRKYNFTHAKYWIIDEGYCISTGNLTYSSFQKNRDMIVCDDEKGILSILESVFLADEKHIFPVFSTPIPADIALSPINMRSRVTEFIFSAKKSIFLYVQDVSDRELLELLDSRARSGIDVRVCVADNDSYEDYSSYQLQSYIMKKPYLHAKAIIVDDQSLMIGSVNLSENALDRNREVSLFFPDDTQKSEILKKLFFADCTPQKFAK